MRASMRRQSCTHPDTHTHIDGNHRSGARARCCAASPAPTRSACSCAPGRRDRFSPLHTAKVLASAQEVARAASAGEADSVGIATVITEPPFAIP
jgi:hypothetical protein